MAQERLQKVLARAGIASRRAAESLITARRVRVDGRIVSELGVRVDPRAKIEVDGRVVVAEPLVYLVLHKPRGVVCTLKDPEGRPTVAEYLKDVGARVVPVGRLDFHTSGALICTNDGELASKLMHPRHHAEKEYVAKVGGVVDERGLERFRERIVIDGRETQPAEVRLLRVEDGKSWLSVKLGEGRNRQVRRLGEHAGMQVMRLVRVAHAGIDVEGLRPGEWRRLSTDELRALQKQYGVPRRIHAGDARAEAPRGGHLARRKPTAAAEGRARAPARFAEGEERPRTVRGEGAWGRGSRREEQRPSAPRREDARSRGPRRDDAPGRGPRRNDAPGRDPRRNDAPGRGPRRNDGPGRGPRRNDGPGRGPRRDDAPARAPRRDDGHSRGPRRDDARGPRRDDARGRKR